MLSEKELRELQKQLEAEKACLAEERRQIQEQRSQLTKDSQELARFRVQPQTAVQASTHMGNMAEGSKTNGTTNIIGSIGGMREFALNDDFEVWFEQFEEYITANNIPNERSVSLFLTLIGTEGYKLVRNLCVPEKPRDKSLSELVNLMKYHLNPKPNLIAERFKFKQSKQKANDNISTFLATLKQLALHCEFGEILGDNLRDQLVWGLRNEKIQRRLLAEKHLTYERAVELSLSWEAVEKEAGSLNQSTSNAADAAVNFIAKKGIGSRPRGQIVCFCCGKLNHRVSECRYKDFMCNVCGRKGHLAIKCRDNKKSDVENRQVAKNRQSAKSFKKISKKQHFLDEDHSESFNNLFHLSWGKDKPINVELTVEGEQTVFEVDSGSPVSAISTEYWRKRKDLTKLKMNKTEKIFRTYSGGSIVPRGVLKVRVAYRNRDTILSLFVLPGNNPIPIIGRDGLKELDIVRINNDSTNCDINKIEDTDSVTVTELKEKYTKVFAKNLGKCTTHKLSLALKENAKPIFCKPRPVPFAMREKVEKEINRLIENKILEPVESSEWATPVVPVVKNNGDIRLCGDYKTTVNPQLIVNKYPIPRVTDLLSQLEEGRVFSKIDLAHAYQQVELEDSSKDLTTISTHKGLFRFNRLSFGIASAPGAFQNLIEEIMRGLKGIIIYFDDMLIFGKDLPEHNKHLDKVLERLENNGLTASYEKCFFAKEEVNFLGFQLNKRGIHIAPDKISAITRIKPPSTVTELKSFLGIVNYYAKFIKNYSMVAAPLFNLLRKNTKYYWSTKCHLTFKRIKSLLASHETLTHYRSEVPIKVTCDASPRGVGAVLTHIFPKGEERPIAFASRTLTPAEQKYSQLDKEALALIFAVKYFHQYIYGRRFILETDHKPLIYIFGPKKGIPQMAASRVQRWAVLLAAYDFEIRYIKGEENVAADSLSRLPMESAKAIELERRSEDYTYLNFVTDNVPSLDSREISLETAKDPILSLVKRSVVNGWPEKTTDQLSVFKKLDLQLSVERGCVMWGHRVVIPEALRKRVLSELHSAHLGIMKMKMLARSYVWWPKIDKNIESMAKVCSLCSENAGNPPRVALHNWSWPSEPNQRVHIDFCGPIDGHMFLVIIDSHSKWVDVKEMVDIRAGATINALREYFSTWGIPRIIVSDNGPTFTSAPFKEFLRNNSISQILTAPYHPASNGAAENAVKHFKNKFKLLKVKMSRSEALSKYLFAVRSSVHSTTGVTPAELQIGRLFRTRLDAIKPTVSENVARHQEKQKEYYKGQREKCFDPRDSIFVKDYSANVWRKAVVESQCSPVTYNVRTDDNRLWKRHVDQMRSREVSGDQASNDCDTTSVKTETSDPDIVTTGVGSMLGSAEVVKPKLGPGTVSLSRKNGEVIDPVVRTEDGAVDTTPALRRSSRVKKPRQILDL